jgi:uncharacterized protein
VDRVFLDANVLFSAAWREDAGLLALWQLDSTALLTSQYAVDEALANLPDQLRRERLRALLSRVTVGQDSFEDVPVPASVSLPEDDLPILRAAIGMGASHLLTGDLRHFGALVGRRTAGVKVLRPAEYLRLQRIA